MKIIIFTSLIFLAFAVNQLYGYCSEPSAPYGPPDPPYCAKYNSQECDQWDIRNYKSELEYYLNKLNDYANDVKDYLSCKQQEVESNWNDVIKS